MSASPPTGGGVGEARGRELVAVEARAGEEIGDLRAVGRVVGRACASQGSVSIAGSRIRRRRRRRRSLPRRAPPSGSRSGARCSSARWASSAGGAGEDRDRLQHRRREVEVEQHRGDRHRDVHRQRLAPGRGDRRLGRRARAPRAGRRRRAPRPARGCARRAGRPACAADGRSRAPCRRAADRRDHRRDASSPRPSMRARASTRKRPQSSAVPSTTEPQPRMPAATAPCSDAGSAA